MCKKIFIILSSALFLCAAQTTEDFAGISDDQNESSGFLGKRNDDASIARDKSRFFIGGVLGSVSFNQNVSVSGSREVRNVTPGSVTGNFSCQKMPDGSTSCSGTGGVHIISGDASNSNETISKTYEDSASSMSYGGRFGYNYFFTPRNGLRFMVAFSRANLKIAPNKYGIFQDSIDSSYYTGSAGVDYLLDFTKGRSPFGLFLGVGYDYNFGEAFSKLKEKDSTSKTSGAYMNFGISQTISRRVRIDLGYKVLFYKYFDSSYQLDSTKEIATNRYEEFHIKGQEKLSSGVFYGSLDVFF